MEALGEFRHLACDGTLRFIGPSGEDQKRRVMDKTLALVLATIVTVVRHYRPMLFFGAASAVVGISGLAAALPVISDWLSYHYIYHVPLAILATGLEIVAMLSLGIGLILDSVVHLERLAYERDLMSRWFE